MWKGGNSLMKFFRSLTVAWIAAGLFVAGIATGLLMLRYRTDLLVTTTDLDLARDRIAMLERRRTTSEGRSRRSRRTCPTWRGISAAWKGSWGPPREPWPPWSLPSATVGTR